MKIFLETCLPRGVFSAAWSKRSLLYDQTIEDINIFSPAFWIELRGVAQLTWWLNLPQSPLQWRHILPLFETFLWKQLIIIEYHKEMEDQVNAK